MVVGELSPFMFDTQLYRSIRLFVSVFPVGFVIDRGSTGSIPTASKRRRF